MQNRITKEARIEESNNKKQNTLSKIAAKKNCAKAAEKQRKKHSKSLKKSTLQNLSKQQKHPLTKSINAKCETLSAIKPGEANSKLCKSVQKVTELAIPQKLDSHSHLQDDATTAKLESAPTVVKHKIITQKCGPPSKSERLIRLNNFL